MSNLGFLRLSMIPGIPLRLFLTVPLITDSEYGNNIYLVLESKTVLLKVVLFVTQQTSHLWFFDFTMVWIQYAFSRNRTSDVEFWSLPHLVICGTILWRCWAMSHNSQSGLWSQPMLYCGLCCQWFLDIVFWVFASRHVYKTPICVSCFWLEDEGSYSWVIA